MKKKTQEEIADRHEHIQHQEKHDADHKDNQKEGSAAAGMETGKGLGILRQ